VFGAIGGIIIYKMALALFAVSRCERLVKMWENNRAANEREQRTESATGTRRKTWLRS